MMKNLIFRLVFFSFLLSCQYKKTAESEELQVKQTSTEANQKTKINISVVNDLDLICKMNTKDYLSDTATYNQKIYGFCSKMCKDEFVKSPLKYIDEK